YWFGGIPYQKIFLLFLILVFCMWNAKLSLSKAANFNKIYKTIVFALFIISFLNLVPVIIGEIKHNWSGSKEMAEYIKKNIKDENTFIYIGFPYTISPLSSYLPDKNFYYFPSNKYLTYFAFEGLKNQTKPIPHSKYWIVQDDYEIFEDYGFKELYKTSPSNLSTAEQKEIYTLYELKTNEQM
ncbi:MAG: hypothetical protein LUG16_00365, partial [Candidatus Gastranaerophilales bacterium]|nr:hypothetical protein [Candidatus Gastranaerophilales bacterium]